MQAVQCRWDRSVTCAAGPRADPRDQEPTHPEDVADCTNREIHLHVVAVVEVFCRWPREPKGVVKEKRARADDDGCSGVAACSAAPQQSTCHA